jgi:hypothetical protein
VPFKKRRLKPALRSSPHLIRHAAFIHVSNPRRVAHHMYIGLCNVPLIPPPLRMLSLHQGHDRVPIKSCSRIVEVKPRRNHRMKFRKIIKSSGREDRLHRIDNLPLIRTQRSLLTAGATNSDEKHKRKAQLQRKHFELSSTSKTSRTFHPSSRRYKTIQQDPHSQAISSGIFPSVPQPLIARSPADEMESNGLYSNPHPRRASSLR